MQKKNTKINFIENCQLPTEFSTDLPFKIKQYIVYQN